MIYFITAPACICLLLISFLFRFLDLPAFQQRWIHLIMPESARAACDVYNGNNFSFMWPPDYYGHLNLVIGRDKKVYYHNIFRPMDKNPCHHLKPDSTQINISEKDFKKCTINDLRSAINQERVRRSLGERFIVTFSFVEGSKWQDFITVLDLMDECGVKIYCLRDLTSTEEFAIKKMVASGL